MIVGGKRQGGSLHLGMFSKYISLLICIFFLVSCGAKKKTTKTTEKIETIQRTVQQTVQKEVITTDSTTTLLNIVSLNIVALDSTQPIEIIDHNGNSTKFYNVKRLTSTKDNSIVQTKIKTADSIVATATAGVTTNIKETSIEKSKTKIDTTIIYIGIGLLVLFSLRKYIRRLFIPL